MPNRERPLSPFMLGTLYRLQITSVLSILHRITGIVLSLGGFVLAWWLLTVAQGGDAYASAAAHLASPLGKAALFGFSFSLMYHLFNGLRHMMWDVGWGYDTAQVNRTGYAVVVLTLISTAAIWFFAMRGDA